MNKRFAAGAILVAAGAAAAGLFAGPSNSAASNPYCKFVGPCGITLTGTGPSPSKLTMHALRGLYFINQDSVTHTVVFANGLCSLAVTPGEQENGGDGAYCKSDFTAYVGTYAYTVDGKFPGTVVTTPIRRSVTLTARTHTIRSGARLTLHGMVAPPGWRYHVSNPPGWKHNVTVTVLARPDGQHSFRPVASVNPRLLTTVPGRWLLTVRPEATTTYIAKVTSQLPQGQIWTNAKSRPFRVRIQR
jgi:hypothetical protein